ncbi:unknown protein [Microcystis aeruginosa NIES-843]|uniref:Uncharacterized protein n=1 Tax=Microcystis aeruginosa (strain NIES-843 / IAM M-2473) TaxID=449447 RepID=B0JWF0_MICAN|nr:unknown protein [Microcystis aeruginosa NIES-843]
MQEVYRVLKFRGVRSKIRWATQALTCTRLRNLWFCQSLWPNKPPTDLISHIPHPSR